jgi:hypothetical protein
MEQNRVVVGDWRISTVISTRTRSGLRDEFLAQVCEQASTHNRRLIETWHRPGLGSRLRSELVVLLRLERLFSLTARVGSCCDPRQQ